MIINNDPEFLSWEDEQNDKGIEDENILIRINGQSYLVGKGGILNLFEEQEELTSELIDILEEGGNG